MTVSKLLVSAIIASPLFSLQAFAGVITYAGYSLDESTNIVTGGGLEWLQWDETKHLSVDSALAEYADDGWSLATSIDMGNMLESFGSFSSYEISSDTIASYDSFISLFGTTWLDHETRDSAYWVYSSASAVFLDDDRYQLASVYRGLDDGYDHLSGFRYSDDSRYNYSLNQYGHSGAAGYAHGIALVRSVVEPMSISLFGLGLVCLGLSNRTRFN
jgi:hypothetical protein